MRRGEQLNWIKNIVSTMNITNPALKTFLLTHPLIVGHGGKGTHQDMDGDHDRPFVEWVNGEDSDYPEGQYVEAVFCGHWHENWIFHDITVDNMNNENPLHYDDPTCLRALYFKYPTFYIETTTATKEYKHD